VSTSRYMIIGSRWLAILVITCGCAKSVKLPPTVPVSGTVTYNGQPLEGATVTFMPADRTTGKTASGISDAQGNFEMETFVAGAVKAKGALAGDYQVTIAKLSQVSMLAPKYMEGGTTPTGSVGMKDSPEQAKIVIPADYANPEKSGFKASVKASDNQPFTFALTGQSG
jgi:hypothetical protein